MRRRTLLGRSLALPLALALGPARVGAYSRDDIRNMQQDWKNLLPAGFEPPDPAAKVSRTEDQWREILSAAAFDVLREEGTERSFTSPLNDEKRRGVFVCAGCELPLFTSAMKYDSGTGWPSFFTHIPGALEEKKDFKLFWPRTEYHCTRCGGHQGHVFADGPPPTGERWCNNGVALKFLPA